MNAPKSTVYTYTAEAQNAAMRLNPGTIDASAHKLGLIAAEPLIIAMDALIKYATVYKARFEQPLAEDYVLSENWLDSLKGLRGLLNGDGAIAMERGISTDSKSNGACEEMFWRALEAAGFTEETANL